MSGSSLATSLFAESAWSSCSGVVYTTFWVGPLTPCEIGYQKAACGNVRLAASGLLGWLPCLLAPVGCVTVQPSGVRLKRLRILSRAIPAAAIGACSGSLHVDINETVVCMLQ